MILVTIVCVLLGGFAARANHLKRWADYHDREADRLVSEVAAERGLPVQLVNQEAQRIQLTKRPLWYVGKHRELANNYREAMFRPWMVVEEWPNQWPEPKAR